MDNRLKLTQSRLASFRMQGPGLRKLTSQYVAKNIGLFLATYEQRTRLAKLPAVARRSVLEDLAKVFCQKVDGDMSAFLQMWEAVQLLLSSETRTFDMDWLMSYCPTIWKETFTKLMLNVIASSAPNIKFLHLNHEEDFYTFGDPMWFFDIQPLNAAMFNSISKMSSLKQLDLTKYTLSFKGVTEICRNLINLQHLICYIVIRNFRVEVKVQDLKLLGNLTVFFFQVSTKDGDCDKCKEYRMKLTQLCLQNLPKIEFIGEKYEYKAFHMDFEPDLELKGPSNLQKLVVSADCHLTEKLCQMMPCVENLEIHWNDETHQEDFCKQLLEFENIVRLDLFDVPSMKMWRRFMRNYGAGLQALSLSGDSITLSYKKIFDFCPNLQNLEVGDIEIVEDTKSYDIQMFSSLKELTLSFDDSERTGAIKAKILLAPNLQKVTLNSSTKLERSDVRNLTKLVADRALFQHLTYFEMSQDYVDEDNHANFNACADLFKNVCAFAPKLVNVHYYVDSCYFESDNESDEDSSYDDIEFSREYDNRLSPADHLVNLGEEILNEFIASFKD